MVFSVKLLSKKSSSWCLAEKIFILFSSVIKEQEILSRIGQHFLMWFLFIAGICCFAQTDIVGRGGMASVGFFFISIILLKTMALKWSKKLSLTFSELNKIAFI